MSPALASAYFFWTRHRRGLTLLGGCWLAVMIFCLAVPSGVFDFASDEPSWPAFVVYAALCCSAVALVGFLIYVFTFGREARLEACESAFPARLWTLPLPLRTLAGWPMLWGSATLILVWLMLAWAVRRVCSFDMPLLGPGLLLAVLLAWWQALLWTPFPLPWLRVYLLILVSTVLLSTPTIVLNLGGDWAAVCGFFAALLLAAYGTALRGVARARCGASVPWNWPTWLRWRRAARTHPPFRSAARAQLWFEWRLHGRAFPVGVAFFAILLLPLTAFYAKILDNQDGLEQPIVPKAVLQELGSLWLAAASFLLPLPPFAAGMYGPEMGKLGRKSCSLSSFLATRPISEAMLVRAKLVATAWSTLAAWGGLAVLFLLWLVLSGHRTEAAQQFEALRQRQEPRLFWGWLIILVGGAMATTWLQLVQGMWVGLTGSRRVIERVGLCFLAAFYGLIALSYGVARHPEYWPILCRLLPWLAGGAVLLKSLAAAWSLHALRRRRLIPSGVLWGTLAIWLALAAGLFAALYALLPDDWFSVPGAVFGIVLLLPLTRLALAPLALSWNRHR